MPDPTPARTHRRRDRLEDPANGHPCPCRANRTTRPDPQMPEWMRRRARDTEAAIAASTAPAPPTDDRDALVERIAAAGGTTTPPYRPLSAPLSASRPDPRPDPPPPAVRAPCDTSQPKRRPR